MLLPSRDDAHALVAHLEDMGADERDELLRGLLLSDLWFMLWFGLGRPDADNEWCWARCREVQANPDGYLDLWAREHYKSTIITFALTIQDILRDPEITVGIFSHTRPNAKGFLSQIKREFEGNQLLRSLFPDILWGNPNKDAPRWAEDTGIIVRRQGNPKEATVEAWGIVDGQPIGKHFALMIFDDVVTRDAVGTPEMLAKVTESWALSLNLGAHGGRVRYIGTRYHANDTYAEIIARQAAKPRVWPAEDEHGQPAFLTREQLQDKRRTMGPYVYACQMLQNPVVGSQQTFNRVWLRTWERNPAGLNKYIVADPANSKKRTSDYTSIWVVGLGADGNYYVLDIVRDRLSLTERADALFDLHKAWKPLAVGYEQYGMMADIQHFEDRMERENYRFTITSLGGKLSKVERINRLIPIFEQGRVWLPRSLYKTDFEGRAIELVGSFVEEEFACFPVPRHDDMLDALSRLLDPELPTVWPKEAPKVDRYAARPQTRRATSWMCA